MRTSLFIALSLLLSVPIAIADESVRLMSFNIRLGVAKDGPNHWEKRKELVIEVFEDHSPDIAGLQEAWKFQIDEILAAAPGFSLVGRSRQDDPKKGEWCPILYLDVRFELLDSGTFWLSETPEKAASMSWGNKIPRICTWAKFLDRRTGAKLCVFNTHFDHLSQGSRLSSAELCMSRVQKQEEEGLPVVLMGDFNAGKSNEVIGVLDAGLVDTFSHLHPDISETGTFGGWTGKTSGERIDYIFVDGEKISVAEAEIVHDHDEGNRYPSDHYPVTAIVEIAPDIDE